MGQYQVTKSEKAKKPLTKWTNTEPNYTHTPF